MDAAVSKRLALRLSLATLGGLLSLAMVEGGLRLSGFRPWQRIPFGPGAPILTEPDPTLGWRPVPGRHRMTRSVPGSEEVWMTIEPDRTRATGSRPVPGRPRVALIGCSFTFGWAVDDEDTFAWRLGERLRSSAEVTNLGVIGYGTYQSLLRLEQLLAGDHPPRWVLYGFIGDHENRNVAHPMWTYLMDYNLHGRVTLPFCRLQAAGGLACHPDARHSAWPLRRQLATATLLEQTYLRAAGLRIARQAKRVTDLLLLEMAERSRARHVEFAVVALSVKDERWRHYKSFLDGQRIRTIDCRRQLTGDLVLPEHHPSERAHALWADCIADALSKEPAVGEASEAESSARRAAKQFPDSD